ncbi:MAG: trypsin-like peptidase domain-containing protein [Ruminococcus sp.]|nr:trypsin-like peptidase domain-containing protein [Ruminococcus sp.]
MENNNFNNDFLGAEPQKPFTERQDNAEQTTVQQRTPSQEPAPTEGVGFEPDLTFETQNTENVQDIKNEDYSVDYGQQNTYQNTYQNNYCQQGYDQSNYHQPNYPQQNYSYPNVYQQNNPQNIYNQQGYNPNGYVQGNYQQPNMQNMYAPNGFNQPQNYPMYQQAPAYMPNFNNQVPYAQAPYAQMPPKPPKKKMGGGLIALIAVLSVLLVGSIVGMVVYAANANNRTHNDKYSDKSNSFTMPYGYGDGYNYFAPEETTDPIVHKESDYSDKINKNYGGLKLEDKPKDAGDKKYTSESAYNKVADSVVGIVCYTGEITSVEDCSSQGSGIIISSDGYVLTNSHVINNSKTDYLIQIVTADGKEYTAGVVGFDSRTDIAVLKMDNAKDLKPATFGDSSKIELGEDIIAVGNPGGLDYQNSITKGIVSAVDRELSSTSLVKYIQTDAAINPGNSGGPVVNLYGQVIGVATSKIVSEQYEGMGFAIPSKTVKEIFDELVRNGFVSGRVKIGISGTNVTAAMASQYDVPQGILVAEIIEGGPCDGTELMEDDIIIEADGAEIKTFSDIYEVLEKHKEGDKIKLTYYRASDDKEGTIEITLQSDIS